MRTAIVLGLSLLAVVGSPRAHAQPRFSELERAATEVPAELGAWAAPLLVDCRGRAPAEARRCLASRRSQRTALARRSFYVELPPETHVVVGPYEPTAGGFHVRVPGFAFEGPDGRGRLSTRPFVSGSMPEHRLGEGFVAVPRERAAAFVAANEPASLVLRLVFRLGDEWEDASRPGSPDGYGVTMTVLGLQVFHSSSGQVLVDTTRTEALPPFPARLDGRAPIWTETSARDVAYATPDGRILVLAGRVSPSLGPDGAREAVLLLARGGEVSELLRFSAPCCSATIDARPLGDERVLAILTERASTETSPGRGEAVLLVWDRDASTLVARARWSGANGESPPAWVTDPTASWE